MVIVRLLLFFALATVALAGLLYFVTHDRRYLRFIAQVGVYTLLLLLGVMLYFVVDRLFLS